MENLLIINDMTFPEPEGSYSIAYEDKVNEYESESGETTIEVIRKNICKISVKYNGFKETRLRELASAIQTVNSVKYYNPLSGAVENKTMKANTDRISIEKKYYKYGRSIWSLSFDLEEM